MNTANPVARYFDLLVGGRYSEILGLFLSDPSIDDPRAGRIRGRVDASAFSRSFHSWLQGRKGRLEVFSVTETEERSVAEALLGLDFDNSLVELPVAAVGDHTSGLDAGLEAIRVYHSMWPLIGGHEVRPPLLSARHDLAIPDVVGEYQRALAEGDLEVIIQTFEPDGCAREPSGGQYMYCGTDALRRFYGILLSEGGIPLDHCTIIDDGVRCAIEFNAVKWGKTVLPPQAGVAVYERGPIGRLSAARIYDDVDPPASCNVSVGKRSPVQG